MTPFASNKERRAAFARKARATQGKETRRAPLRPKRGCALEFEPDADAAYGFDFEATEDFRPTRESQIRELRRIEAESGIKTRDLVEWVRRRQSDPLDAFYLAELARRLHAAGYDTYDSDTRFVAFAPRIAKSERAGPKDTCAVKTMQSGNVVTPRASTPTKDGDA